MKTIYEIGELTKEIITEYFDKNNGLVMDVIVKSGKVKSVMKYYKDNRYVVIGRNLKETNLTKELKEVFC